MSLLKSLAAAAVLVAPLFFVSAPAQALTAHQYQKQGQGRYVSSTKRAGRMYHRSHRYGRHHDRRRM